MRNAVLRSVTLAAGTTGQLAGQSKNRRVLVFSPNLTTGYTVAPAAPVVADAGLVVTAAAGPLVLRYEEVGTLVQQAWYGIAAAQTVVGVLEAYELT